MMWRNREIMRDSEGCRVKDREWREEERAYESNQECKYRAYIRHATTFIQRATSVKTYKSI